jgi:hypothetical protein
MRSASCGFEVPYRMKYLPPYPPVSTTAPLFAHASMPSGYIPRHPAAKLLIPPACWKANASRSPWLLTSWRSGDEL